MTPNERRKVLVSVTASVFVTYGCFLFLTPLYPVVAHDLKVGPDTLGAIVGVASVLSAILQIPVGIATDRIGRRLFLAGGMVAVAVAQLLRWRAGDATLFTIAQAVVGLSLPLTASAGYAAVADAYAHSNRAQALGTVTASISLGQVGGLLTAALFGGVIDWRTLSLLLVAFPLIVLGPLLLMPEPPRAATRATAAAQARDAVRFLFLRQAATLAAIGALALGAGIAATYLLPFALREHGAGPGTGGMYLLPYVVGAMFGPPFAGWIADRAGNRRPMLACILVGGLMAAVVGVTGPALVAVVVTFFLMGSSLAAVLSLAANEILELVSERPGIGTGAALGGLRMGQAVGPAFGPALAGASYARGGLSPSFFGIAGALAMALVLALSAVGRGNPGKD